MGRRTWRTRELVAELRSVRRGADSLRHLARRRMSKVRQLTTLGIRAVRARHALWKALARPTALPFVLPMIVLLLGILDPRGPLPTLLHRDSRSILGVLWQVEGAVLALVTAAALFAFESLTRSRPAVPLSEYAARSGLTQFLMLGSAGLLSVALVVLWPRTQPPEAAAHVAALVALLGLVSLPILFAQAMRVIHPDWLRAQRLEEVRTTVGNLVDIQALELSAMVELEETCEGQPIEVQRRLGVQPHTVLEHASVGGVVFDFDLQLLKEQSKEVAGGVVILTRLGDRVIEGAPLIVMDGDDDVGEDEQESTADPWREVCTVIPTRPAIAVDSLLTQLREEGAEAIRSESVAAIDDVATSYVDLLLAWPEAWGRYGQRIADGLLRFDPFVVGPVDTLQRHVWGLTESAVARGLREHVLSLTGIALRVGMRVIPVDATDVLRAVLVLARNNVVNRSQDSADLQTLVNDRAAVIHIDLCRFVAEPRFYDTTLDIERRLSSAESIEVIYRSTAETIKRLAQVGRHEQAVELDRRFRLLDQYRDHGASGVAAAWLLEHAEQSHASDEDLRAARQSVRLDDQRRHLDRFRRSCRLQVLAWLVRSASPIVRDSSWEELVETLIDTVGSADEVSEAIDMSLSSDLLSDWIMYEQPSDTVQSVDSQRPIFVAFALVMLSTLSGTKDLSPRPWMTQERTKLAKEALVTVTKKTDLWKLLKPTSDEAALRVEALKGVLTSAELAQRAQEEAQLIAQPLDDKKLEEYASAAKEACLTNRLTPKLAELGGVEIGTVYEGDWEGGKLPIRSATVPKGIFSRQQRGVVSV